MAVDSIVERLAKLDTCAVSDAQDKLGIKGTVIGIAPLYPTGRIAGRAVTVKLKSKGDQEVSTRHLCTTAVEASDPGDIIVIDHRGRPDVAGWGGILSTAAKTKGLAGVIIDGATRDVDEAHDLGLPLFARAAVPLTARGRIIEESTNEPVEIGGVAVRPGDYVIADNSGIVFVPAERAEEVIPEAENIVAREAAMARDVLAGKSVVEVMGTNYEQMLSR
ncbi:MAG: RraA family protein [Dehalococcoidia bacterium]